MTTTHHDAGFERRTIRRVLARVLPLLMIIYFVNYLDRTNIGFAKLQMSEELALTATMFGLASGLFFIGYVIVEVPSNIALHRFGARLWIARIMITWGIIASAMAFVPNATWLYILRFLLGIAEAGLYPGVILYLTFWFPARYRTRVVALFLVASPIASVIGSPLSTWIMEATHGLFGLSGWRLMFLVEGIPAIILAFLTLFYLKDSPAKAKWLKADEREWLTSELEAEAQTVSSEGKSSLKDALLNPRVLALALVYFCIIYGQYALAFFLPTIVSGFQDLFGVEFSLIEIGFITAIPYAITAIAMILWSRHSDRTGERTWHVIIPIALGAVTIPAALYLSNVVLAVLAVSVCAAGIFSAIPIFWSLPSQFLTGVGAAGAIALINSLGNVAGFAAPYATGALNDASGSSNLGLWVVGGVLLLGAVIVFILRSTIKNEAAPAVDSDQPVRPASPRP